MCSAPYEEFALLRQNADEYGLAWEGDPVVERRAVEVEPGRSLMVVGMSLGGLTAMALATQRPELVRRLALVDVKPGGDSKKAEPIIAFISGPEVFATFDEILERTIRFNPGRSEASLRRGILHNAKELADGSWSWRWDPNRPEGGPDTLAAARGLWDELERIPAPLLCVRAWPPARAGR